jgi:hypothetical protein
VEYKFIARHAASNRYCDAANVLWEPAKPHQHGSPPSPRPPIPEKNVSILDLDECFVVYRAWRFVHGEKNDAHRRPGRFGGDTLYRVDRIGEAGEALEFVLQRLCGRRGSLGQSALFRFQNNYYTDLDVFLLQDKQIYNYWPPATVTGPRLLTNWVNSTAPGHSGRNIGLPAARVRHEHLETLSRFIHA